MDKLSLPRRIAQLGAVIGTLCVPIAAWGVYERAIPLPEPLNEKYPFLARYYIRRALWAQDVNKKALYLDYAMRNVLNSGIGAASPQSTALVIYLSHIYYNEPIPDVNNLKASFAALTHKPHVGEGVREERSRLQMAFKVGAKLLELVDKHEAHTISEKALGIMDRSPPFMGDEIKNNPLKDTFQKFI